MTYQASLVESPMDQVCVALDLETTGLNPDSEDIIEVGAVKFRGKEVLDTFQSLVNPGRPVPPEVVALTGITPEEIAGAPAFYLISRELTAFLGSYPLVGHNVSFDLGFLRRKGLAHANPAYDTLELASVLLPRGPDYGLGRLAANLGLPRGRLHRALDDADVTRRLFLTLVERALELPPALAVELARLAAPSGWRLAPLLRQVESVVLSRESPTPGAEALDLAALRRRLTVSGALNGTRRPRPVDLYLLDRLFSWEGPLARRFPSYESRPEQQAMSRHVARALNEGEHVVVEAGTGVGKSLAYLLPAVLFAAHGGRRVVVSTATINLQEQLVQKDLPALLDALGSEPGLLPSAVRFAQLKGRANYLCLRRWLHLREREPLSPETARMLAKTLLWLRETCTGDRAEMAIPAREMGQWARLSAKDARECNTVEGVCFLRHARSQAEGAHILVVNHALLLADVARGGGLLPEYDHLIVDEAHHLEEEATKQFGFRVAQGDVEAILDAVAGAGGVIDGIRAVVGASTLPEHRRDALLKLLQRLAEDAARCRLVWGELSARLYRLLLEHQEGSGESQAHLRVTRATRAQPGWSDLEIAWENADLVLKEVQDRLQEAREVLEVVGEGSSVDYAAVTMEATAQDQAASELRGLAREFVVHPREEMVYWLASEVEGIAEMHAAPLEVGTLLEERLFSQKEVLVLTSATLSAGGTFGYFRERVGVREARECLVGSPFDYQRAVLLAIPRDMPEPSSPQYLDSLGQALTSLATAAGGRTMVLFTSYAALRATHAAIKVALEPHGINVLGQGIDGQPRHLVSAFLDEPRCVLLGTASFWEGVDLPGGPLKVLVLARLPFHVPTEPIFAARSQQYDDPFNGYAVPQAVLRFRQGFGRLIRSKEDKGVVVVLDRRIISKAYGKSFLDAIPACTVSRPLLEDLPADVRQWLGEG